MIRRAYEIAAGDLTLRATDDRGVLLHLPEVSIYVVPGDEQNLKVTYPGLPQLVGIRSLIRRHSCRSRGCGSPRSANRVGTTPRVTLDVAPGFDVELVRRIDRTPPQIRA